MAGTLSLIAGFLVLTRPTLAEIALTLLVALLFVVGGLYRVSVALMTRFPTWGWVVFDGSISAALGPLIWVTWPSSALWVIGLLLGIEPLFRGWSCVMLALAARTG
jgi:uncharacterized membrane protein HdeD (DUF308 family)